MKNILVRTCWNDNGYHAPAGVGHLAENQAAQTTYVCNEGFGFEEWNFNHDELVDGMLHGYIRAENNQIIGKNLNIWFYTKSPAKQLFLVGCYKNAYFMQDDERGELRQKMLKNRMLDTRMNQVYETLQAQELFSHVTREAIVPEFGIPFGFKLQVRPEDAILLPEMVHFSATLWSSLGTQKQLVHRYRGYNTIPDLAIFERLMQVAQYL